MTPKPGEVYERDGMRRTVLSDYPSIVSYMGEMKRGDEWFFTVVESVWCKDWDRWAAGARVEKESDDE